MEVGRERTGQCEGLFAARHDVDAGTVAALRGGRVLDQGGAGAGTRGGHGCGCGCGVGAGISGDDGGGVPRVYGRRGSRRRPVRRDGRGEVEFGGERPGATIVPRQAESVEGGARAAARERREAGGGGEGGRGGGGAGGGGALVARALGGWFLEERDFAHGRVDQPDQSHFLLKDDEEAQLRV